MEHITPYDFTGHGAKPKRYHHIKVQQCVVHEVLKRWLV